MINQHTSSLSPIVLLSDSLLKINFSVLLRTLAINSQKHSVLTIIQSGVVFANLWGEVDSVICTFFNLI